MAMTKQVKVTAKLVDKFRVECQIDKHKLIIDQPVQMGGTDMGPTPLQYMHASLAGCLAATARITAMQKKIDIKNLEVTVDGELDLEVIMGKSQSVRAGFNGLTLSVKLDAELTAEQKAEFLKEVERRCPVSDNIANVTPVTIRIV
ncbi:MAG TPA: OsmC family protein [Elusimicrobiota bacterium]|nr:OsmC family protein [Elusimicrobiota bacterium]